MIQIGEAYVCLLDYVDVEVGAHRIVDLVPANEKDRKPTYLVFDNGRILPLLSPDPSDPILVQANGEVLVVSELSGNFLVALGYAAARKGMNPEALVLILSRILEADPDTDEVIEVPLHLDSARGLLGPRYD
jgi:hypothetical protein